MCYIYWLILSFNAVEKSPNKSINTLSKWLITALVIQIIYGAFVAGLKAGYLLPQNGSFFESVFGYTLRNANNFSLLNNGLDIQAFHRLFVWIIFVIVFIIFNKTRKTTLAPAGLIVLGLTFAQITFGILTLLLKIQIHTATAHQFIAIVLLLSVVRLTYLSTEKTQ
jgi:cytochrome c oxidase assembly protein subunit 15